MILCPYTNFSADSCNEIMHGRDPYHKLSNEQFIIEVRKGAPPASADDCMTLETDSIWQLMSACWRPERDRPDAKEVVAHVNNLS